MHSARRCPSWLCAFCRVTRGFTSSAQLRSTAQFIGREIRRCHRPLVENSSLVVGPDGEKNRTMRACFSDCKAPATLQRANEECQIALTAIDTDLLDARSANSDVSKSFSLFETTLYNGFGFIRIISGSVSFFFHKIINVTYCDRNIMLYIC